MANQRSLTQQEVAALEAQGCQAEDWSQVLVPENFDARYVKNTRFYGKIVLGAFEKDVEVGLDFFRHSGIFNATLRNTTVGNDCLIENIGCHINNYRIGEHCCIINVCTMETTEEALYGQGQRISVLNEAGEEGNVFVFEGLTSQLAALTVKYAGDSLLMQNIERMVQEQVADSRKPYGIVGSRVKIINTQEVINTLIGSDSEINGAKRLAECTITGSAQASTYIGSSVICEETIVCDGASVLNSAILQNCFVGEACRITNGFTAENCVFFANSYMSNGEACASFCGPFSASHHKSTLLIGGMFSFYNAGSATNFSNHAYKMGPIHYGILERGTKTASGAHLLHPANIGAFSVCLGKIESHPDTRIFPFSYVIGDGAAAWLVPGRNLMTVGLFRDVTKWEKRDNRPENEKKSLINFDWLSPFTLQNVMQGLRFLQDLCTHGKETHRIFEFNGLKMKESSLRKGIEYYDMAVKLFLGETIHNTAFNQVEAAREQYRWNDLAGLLLPDVEEEKMVEDIKNGEMTSLSDLENAFVDVHGKYLDYKWAWTCQLICEYYQTEVLTEEIAAKIDEDYREARKKWIEGVRSDVQREYDLGDVDEATYLRFMDSIR